MRLRRRNLRPRRKLLFECTRPAPALSGCRTQGRIAREWPCRVPATTVVLFRTTLDPTACVNVPSRQAGDFEWKPTTGNRIRSAAKCSTRFRRCDVQPTHRSNRCPAPRRCAPAGKKSANQAPDAAWPAGECTNRRSATRSRLSYHTRSSIRGTWRPPGRRIRCRVFRPKRRLPPWRCRERRPVRRIPEDRGFVRTIAARLARPLCVRPAERSPAPGFARSKAATSSATTQRLGSNPSPAQAPAQDECPLRNRCARENVLGIG